MTSLNKTRSIDDVTNTIIDDDTLKTIEKDFSLNVDDEIVIVKTKNFFTTNVDDEIVIVKVKDFFILKAFDDSVSTKNIAKTITDIDETIAIDEIDEKIETTTIVVARIVTKIVITFLNQDVL